MTPSWNWVVSPGGSLSAGTSATVVLPICPQGIDTSNLWNYQVYVAGAPGAAETAAVTGGTCFDGRRNGTIVFTPVNTHAAGYTLGSATSGIQEALNYSPTSIGHWNWHVVVPPGEYSIFAPIVIHQTNGQLEGKGSYLICHTRNWCLQVGSLTKSTAISRVEVNGVLFSPSVEDVGCIITSTLQIAGVRTVAFTGSCSYHIGDWVRVDFTDDPAYWGDHKISATANGTVSWLQGSGNISAQKTPGTIALTNDAILDNAQGTRFTNIHYHTGNGISTCLQSRPGYNHICQFNSIIDFWDDEDAYVDHWDDGANAVTAYTTYIGSEIYSGGNVGGAFGNSGAIAPVITISASSITAQCGNGITDYNSNGLRLVGTNVIQAVGLWALSVSNINGNYQGALTDDIYNETSGCGANTPFGTGGAASVIYGPSAGGSSFTAHGLGISGAIPQTGHGTTQFNYWIVAHDATTGGFTAPMLAQTTLNNRIGPIAVKWPRIAPTPHLNQQAAGDRITYDIIRTSGMLGGIGTANGPMFGKGNCLGGTILACGSVATEIPQCIDLGCSFTDSGSASTSSYVVGAPGRALVPTMSFWPGDLIVSTLAPKVYFDTVPPNVISPNGPLRGPIVYSTVAGGRENTITAGIADPNSGEGLPLSSGTILYNTTSNPHTMPSAKVKGRLNFYNLSGNAFGGSCFFTLWDSNPFKTFATVGHRPAADAADTALCTDNAGQGFNNSQVQLAILAPVSTSFYINNLPDNAAYLERLTSSLKTFKVPITTNSQIASTLKTGIPPFSIVSTTPVDNLTLKAHPQLYEAGILSSSEKIYTNMQILRSGSATHTFANGFSFTSVSTFGCTCTDQTGANACKAAPASPTSVTLGGTGDDVLWLSCTGH